MRQQQLTNSIRVGKLHLILSLFRPASAGNCEWSKRASESEWVSERFSFPRVYIAFSGVRYRKKRDLLLFEEAFPSFRYLRGPKKSWLDCAKFLSSAKKIRENFVHFLFFPPSCCLVVSKQEEEGKSFLFPGKPHNEMKASHSHKRQRTSSFFFFCSSF